MTISRSVPGSRTRSGLVIAGLAPAVLVLGSALLASGVPANAAVVTFDLRSGGTAASVSGSGLANTYTMLVDGLQLDILGFGDTASGSKFERAALQRWSAGMGVCNADEYDAGCQSPDHQVDNGSGKELTLFSFNESVQFVSMTIDPYGTFDRDVSYRAGTIETADVVDRNVSQLVTALGGVTHTYNTPSADPLTISFSPGVVGHDLLFGALLGTQDTTPCGYRNRSTCDQVDMFKITSLVVRTTSSSGIPVQPNNAVPEPAGLALAGCGLAVLGLGRRRRQI